jgi:hypothetical protein
MSDQFKYTTGLRNVGSYLAAGSPYVTASTVSSGTEEEITFPRVTNNLTVKLDNPNNSVMIEGVQVYYQNSNVILANDGDSRTITTWISASVDSSGGDNGIIIGGTVSNASFCIREKVGKPFQAVLRSNTDVVITRDFSIGAGWKHLAFVAIGNTGFKVFINGAIQGAQKNFGGGQTTDGDALGGGLVLGPNGSGDTTIKFRDSILWDAALSDAEVLDLYQASASYSDPAFAVANKLVWVKPTESPLDSPVNSLFNLGDPSYGNLALNAFDAGEIAKISSDSPFTNSGSLRVHYRSIGSLPNVANNKHYWTLSSQDEEVKMNIKTKEIYLSAVNGDCDYSLHADMTNIPAARMYQHTGSGVDE